MFNTGRVSGPGMSHLDQTHEEFSARSCLVKYSVIWCVFLLIIDQEEVICQYFFAVARDSPFDTVKLSESCSFGFQFEGPKGGVPANWIFHAVMFRSDKVTFLLNKWILFLMLQQARVAA